MNNTHNSSIVIDQEKSNNFNYKLVSYLGTSVIVGTAGAFGTQQVMAQDASTTAVDDVQTTLDSVSTIATSAVAIVLVALGVRLAIKQVNRIMTKG